MSVQTRGFEGLDLRWTVKTRGFVDPGIRKARKKHDGQSRGQRSVELVNLECGSLATQSRSNVEVFLTIEEHVAVCENTCF